MTSRDGRNQSTTRPFRHLTTDKHPPEQGPVLWRRLFILHSITARGEHVEQGWKRGRCEDHKVLDPGICCTKEKRSFLNSYKIREEIWEVGMNSCIKLCTLVIGSGGILTPEALSASHLHCTYQEANRFFQ